MKRLKKFLVNGSILTLSSLILRGIGVSFNIYISNTVGAEAMGLFTLISTVYSFAVTLATSGISLATTKLVSEALASHSSKEEKSKKSVCGVMRAAIIYSIIFSAVASLLLYLLSEPISISILKDARCIASLKILSLTLAPISLSSVICGYFSAVRKVYKNALSQIAEQMIRIFACIFLLTRFFANDVESACVCIALGGTLSEVLSFIIRAIDYLCERHKQKNDDGMTNTSKSLLDAALPMAFSTYVRSALITIEHILIPRGLEHSGSGRDLALAAYGTVQSMVFPIIFFPSAILSSFSGLLVPELSRSFAQNDRRDIQRIVSNVFESALIFGIGCAGIMTSFSYALGEIIYPQTDAGNYIWMIAPLIPIMYLDTAVDSMLKGLNEQVYSMGVNIVDSLSSVILVSILIPQYGIWGYILTVYFTETLNATLSITRLLKITSIKPLIKRRILAPLISVIVATLCSKLAPLSNLISMPTYKASVILDIAWATAIYITLLFLFGTLRVEKIKKAVNILKK